MKIGIITMTGYQNIGNRLQNYAVQKILEERGHEAITIRLPRYQSDANLSTKAKNLIKNISEKTGLYTAKWFMLKVYKNPKSYLLKTFDDKFVNSTYKYLVTKSLISLCF